MERVLLPAQTYPNAKCLDGSPPGYYIRRANSTKFVVYFQGGGWCYNDAECFSRSSTGIGSSRGWPQNYQDLGGILSPDPTLNPDFFSWNAVWVAYCDGGSYTGGRELPVVYNNTKLFYRGRANMEAVALDLMQTQGLSSATHVIMDGGSAGGLTVLLHADRFRSFLPKSVQRFGAIGDAGWFLPDPSLDRRNYAKQIRSMAVAMNSTCNEACEAAHNDPLLCCFAPTTFPYLQSPMFVLEGAYDSWQLVNILGETCTHYYQPISNCSAEQNATILNYGHAMRTSIRAALTSTPHHQKSAGAFVSSCIIHVQSAINENHDAWDPSFLVAGPDKRAVRSVVAEWFFETGPGRLVEDCDFPCNPKCQIFT